MKKNLPTYCVGIDGCKDGWVTVYSPLSSFDKAKAQHYQTLSQMSTLFRFDLEKLQVSIVKSIKIFRFHQSFVGFREFIPACDID